jgi:hypothetical protein
MRMEDRRWRIERRRYVPGKDDRGGRLNRRCVSAKRLDTPYRSVPPKTRELIGKSG